MTNANTLDPRLTGWQDVRHILLAALERQDKGILVFGEVKFDFWEYDGCVLLSAPNRLSGCDFVFRKDGTLYPTKAARQHPREIRRELWNCLLELRERPFDYLTQQGRHTGQCIMCGKTLTDPESIARGIGPVCGGRVYKILNASSAMRQTSLDVFS